jgi:O-antigen/teichoic acid export membrane protein
VEYAKKAGRAIVYLSFRRFWTVLVNFGVMAYLARELDKQAFGIVAISAILITFSSSVGTGGLGEFIIYKKTDKIQSYYSAAFWLNVLVALGVTLGILVIAPGWARFYGDDRIQWITIILAFRLLFSMLGTVPNAIFRKELNFQPVIWATTVSFSVSAVLKVLFVFLGMGVYSLALPELLVSPFLFLYLIIKSGFKPSLNWHTNLWGEIIQYSKGLIGSRIINKVANEGDTVLTGKFLGVATLGVYNLAFQVSNVFTNNIMPIINEISYPFMVKIADQEERLRNNYLKMIGSIAFISFPLLIFLMAAAKNVVLIWYGPKWTEVILPLQILLIFTLSRSVSSPTGGLFQVTGRNDLAFYNSLLNTVFIIAGVVIGSLYGLIGICIGVTVARVATGQYQIVRAVRLIGMSYARVVSVLWPVLLVATLCGLAAMFSVKIVSTQTLLGDVIIQFVVFATMFILLFRIVFKRYIDEYLFLIKKVYPALYVKMASVFGVSVSHDAQPTQ